MSIRAKFVKEIFYNDENGFSVFLYKQLNAAEYSPKENGQLFSASGYYLPNGATDVYLTGNWEKYKGRDSYIVESYEEKMPSNEEALIKYLSSGLIKGIGKITAKRIVNFFGMNALDIIENDTERLLEIKGITPKKLKKIQESYINTKLAKDYIIYFAKYGISPTVSGKIYRSCKLPLYSIKQNPYMLCKIRGISFLTADRIASAENLPKDMPDRIKSCLDYCLIKEEQSGHCGANAQNIIKRCSAILKINGKIVTDMLNKQIGAGEIVSYKGYLFRKKMYDVETQAAREIIRLKHGMVKSVPDIDRKIAEWEKSHFTLDQCQRDAVKMALSNGFSIITGGPGCGKTTILKCVLDIRKGNNKTANAELLAPTGRASKRLRESTGQMAYTIHSKCQILDVENHESEKDLIDAEQLLVDESSMIDVYVLCRLLESVRTGTAVTLIGDPEQLPSVGAGCILRDIIRSGVVPVVMLDTVHRQKGESTIVTNANKMRKGDSNIVLKDDFMLHNVMENDFENSARKMIALYKEKVKEYGQDNVCILSPHHHKETETSVDMMNKALQREFNTRLTEEYVEYRGQTFKVGDLVMQTVNKNDISNGDIGYITRIWKNDDGKKVITVRYDEDVYDYEPDEYEWLELAYAMTIHKSQGSEYQCIIMNLLLAHGIMLKRNLIYTGITRAKKEVHIVGTMDAIKKAIEREDTTVRVTLLKLKLQVIDRDYNPLKEAV